MRFLIIGEYYKPLIPWLKSGEKLEGMPAVFELYSFLGKHKTHRFNSIIYNPDVNRIIHFENGSTINLVKFRFPIYLLWKLIVLFLVYLRSKEELKTNKYEVVYGLSSWTFIAALLAKKFNIFSVGRLYGTILTDLVKQKQWVKLYSRHWLEILAYKYPADLMIGTKDGTLLDKVGRTFNNKFEIKLLYNGMNAKMRERLLGIKTPNVDQVNEFSLLYMARLEPYKQQELALKMMNELVNTENLTNCKLLILGTGSQEKRLRKMIEELELSSYISFKKEVEHEQVPNELSKHQFSLFYYKGGSLGNALWESALAGRVISTIKTGDTASLVKNGVNGLIAENDSNFAQNKARMIANQIKNWDENMAVNIRKDVSEKIVGWEERFELEMRLIEEKRINQK